jgi:hypothetical protein
MSNTHTMHAQLRAMYLDYVNNWITVEAFADHHLMSIPKMRVLLSMGREFQNEYAELCKVQQ